MDTPDMPPILKRKIAGVPVSILLLILVAGLLYMAIRMKSSSSTDTTASTDLGDSGTATDSNGQSADQPIFLANPSQTVSTSTDTTTDSTTSTATDQTWANGAIAWLITQQHASVTNATNAITKYLAGQQLSQDEGRLRDLAVKQFGPPPESGYVQTSTAGYAGPAVRQGNPPTTHTVKGKSDNTPEELARLYYGMTTRDVVQFLESSNTSLTTPYPVGTKVTIPRYHAVKYYTSTQRNNTAAEIARANGRDIAAITALNPGMHFPVKVGTRVRVD